MWFQTFCRADLSLKTPEKYANVRVCSDHFGNIYATTVSKVFFTSYWYTANKIKPIDLLALKGANTKDYASRLLQDAQAVWL